jgi:HEAT repeat protein
MEQVLLWIEGLPLWAYVAAGAAAGAVVGLIVLMVVSRIRFRRWLLALDSRAHEVSPRRLMARSSMVESVARSGSPEVVRLTGIDDLWIEALTKKPSAKRFSRVLRFAPEKGLFACFRAALSSEELARLMREHLSEGKDFLILRDIALSGPGRSFNGDAARAFFSEWLGAIREMTGDPQWAVRYFAITILLNDNDEKSRRAVWETRNDPRALIRRQIILSWEPGDQQDDFFSHARGALLNDPVIEVRTAARDRLLQDYSSRYHFDIDELSPLQAAHLLELLIPTRSEDHNLAIEALGGKDLERALPAALFLERAGVLRGMLEEVRFEDRKELDRVVKLLKNAASAGVTGFLNTVSGNPHEATLYAAAVVLQKAGPPHTIASIAQAALSSLKPTPESREVLESILQAIRDRGSDSSLELLAQALRRQHADAELASSMLRFVPPRSPEVMVPVLVALMGMEGFSCHDELREALNRFPVEHVLPSLIGIITAPRTEYHHQTRITALRTLGGFQKPFLLDFVLEHMSILPVDESREFAVVLAEYAGDAFDERVSELLEGPDASVRSAIIAALPATGHKGFLKQIREAVDDADPEVRVASVWALVGFQDNRALTQAKSRLRDPIERVRMETARALGSAGTSTAVKALSDVLGDDNEVDVVKHAAIVGLGESSATEAIDVLVDQLEASSEHTEEIVVALSMKRSAVEFEHLIERMKDGGPPTKELIGRALATIGQEAEESVIELLQRDIASLRDYIVEVLDQIGFIESTIRRLSHRDPQVRREAARVLSHIGTLSAFRGIVLAARDPDEQVRVEVTKALEGLATPGGQEILNELQKDPEPRVRKYTQWALQRIEAKSR